MDQVSFILLMLLLTLLVMFVKYLCQLYKDRGEVGVMVSSPPGECTTGDYDLPEYYLHGSTEKEDFSDPYTEYGIYQKHTVTENPLYNRTFNVLPSLQPTGAEQRRVQYKLKRHNKNLHSPNVPVEVEIEASRSSSPRPEERLEVSGPPRRDSYAAPCLTCELIKMGSASPYADNSCPQCGKNWSH